MARRKSASRPVAATRAGPVTSRTAQDLTALKAQMARAERVLRATRDPWKALAELGITGERPGRRSIPLQQLEDLAGLYVNMQTWPPPCPSSPPPPTLPGAFHAPRRSASPRQSLGGLATFWQTPQAWTPEKREEAAYRSWRARPRGRQRRSSSRRLTRIRRRMRRRTLGTCPRSRNSTSST